MIVYGLHKGAVLWERYIIFGKGFSIRNAPCCSAPAPALFWVMVMTSILLLLLYSLVFHNFVIIFVVLLQVLALIGTFFG